MNKKEILIIISCVILAVIVGFIGLFSYYFISISNTGDENDIVNFKIEIGSTTIEVLNNLKKEGLIKSVFTAKVYMKLNKTKTIQAGDYVLNKGMNLKEILDGFSLGKIADDEVTITFIEGKRIPYYIKVIANNFPYDEKEIINKINDKVYLNMLIEKYWFITDDILNKDIYYPLEGYIFPDTYNFRKTSSIEDIFNVLIDELEKKLVPYKETILNSGYSIHEILTLASIVELEGVNDEDRAGVAGVFLNRIKDGWSLGSDVTTYYATQKDFDVELSLDEFNSCNAYNTRSGCFKGLPVGPICGISLESLIASIYPLESDYYYFVADKNKKTYFAKNDYEFSSIINQLKKDDLWYTY